MATWKEDIIKALTNLNGTSHLTEIYEEVKKIREEPLPNSWRAIIRGVIERYSTDSEAFGGQEDIFYSVEGLFNGIWGLREMQAFLIATDIEEPPKRVQTSISRIIRDTKLSNDIKKLYNYKCQICGERIRINNNYYAEAHHIKPLGNNHKGLDVAENIIVLCPNHHVMCDFGAIKIDIVKITIHKQHKLSTEYIDYHNNNIYINNK